MSLTHQGNCPDHVDEKKVVELLHLANVFNIKQQPTVPERLQNIITKYVATSIEESLLKANSLEKKKLVNFVKERLMDNTRSLGILYTKIKLQHLLLFS